MRAAGLSACFLLVLVGSLPALAGIPPAVWDQRVSTAVNTAVTIPLRGFDEQGHALTFSIVAKPKRGTLGAVTSTGTASASVVYTPGTNASGLDSFTFRASNGSAAAAGATAVVLVGLPAEPGTLSPRTAQWPLKTTPALHTSQALAEARAVCLSHPEAIAQLRALKDASAYWLAKSDAELRALLPDWRVPRAFNDSVGGCPVHGKAIFAHGTYPWILDREKPFKVTCPVGHESYPDNDFGAYYAGGMADPTLLTGTHVDPGRGWVGASDGEKRWLVAYAIHWHWRQTWVPAIRTLARTWALTGDRAYAQKAIAMLDRVAEIYPSMKHSIQSRYGELQGGAYLGKIVNAIWETAVFRDLAESYDLVFDALTGPTPVSLPWRSAAEIRANVEANLLEEGEDAVGRGEIRGNYGMHQSALAAAAVVRQGGQVDAVLDRLFQATGGAQADEGLDYALYNLVYKDGLAYETGLGYAFLWPDSFNLMSRPLLAAGRDFHQQPRFQRMLRAPLDLVCAGQFTPSLGDSGSVTAKVALPSAEAYRDAYRALGEPGFAWALSQGGAVKDFQTFDDLFSMPMAAKAQADAAGFALASRSRLFDGFGLGLLNDSANRFAVSTYYGPRGSHFHHDHLGLEIVGAGRRLSPDLGYPDFMNAYVPGIYSWSNNTVSHDTLVVDDRKQTGRQPGVALRFHRTPPVQVLDLEAAPGGAYPQCPVYRRTLVLRETRPDASYLVDVFRVKGGATGYTWSAHGGEGSFTLQGATLSDPQKTGTLAGPSVQYGQLYDDPVLGAPGYSGSYSGYTGSGFQHLFNWQKAPHTGVAVAQWTLAGKPEADLRLHLVPAASQEIVVADAYVSPTLKVPTVLKYVLLKRAPSADGDVFVAVWEPVAAGAQVIDHVEILDDPSLGSGSSRVVALAVVLEDGTRDVVTVASARVDYSAGGLATDAVVAVANDAVTGDVFAAGGTHLGLSGETWTVPAAAAGPLVEADYAARTILVQGAFGAEVVGKAVRISNAAHSSVYVVEKVSAEGAGTRLTLGGADVVTGRVKLATVDSAGAKVTTPTTLLFPEAKDGMYLASETLGAPQRIVSVSAKVANAHTVQLAVGSKLSGFSVGDDAWLVDFGPGDHVEVEGALHLVRGPPGVDAGLPDGSSGSLDAAPAVDAAESPDAAEIPDAAPVLLDVGLLVDAASPSDVGSADAGSVAIVSGCGCTSAPSPIGLLWLSVLLPLCRPKGRPSPRGRARC